MSRGRGKHGGRYDVGYGRPPRKSQFRKGRSGNPSGRPKKTADDMKRAAASSKLMNYILEEGLADVTITENGEQVTLPAAQAVLRRMKVDALKGNHKAQVAFVGIVTEAQAGQLYEKQELFKTMVEYLKYCEDEIERCKKSGLPPPELIPHPDDVKLDMSAGDVIFNGPRCPDEKADWGWVLDEQEKALKEMERLIRRCAKDPDNLDLMRKSQAARKRYFELRSLAPPAEVRRRPGFDLTEYRKTHETMIRTLAKMWRAEEKELVRRKAEAHNSGLGA